MLPPTEREKSVISHFRSRRLTEELTCTLLCCRHALNKLTGSIGSTLVRRRGQNRD